MSIIPKPRSDGDLADAIRWITSDPHRTYKIERSALDDNIPLTVTLRECVALAGLVRSPELCSWASRELNGYEARDDVPEWRIVSAMIEIDGKAGGSIIKGQRVNSRILPSFARNTIKEECPLRIGVAALEALLAGSDEFIRLEPPEASKVVLYMNRQHCHRFNHVDRLYWSVSKPVIRNVLNRIRTTLVELMVAIRADIPEDVEVPNAELTSRAVNLVVRGNRNRVTVTTAKYSTELSNQAMEPEQDDSRKWRRWGKIGGFIVGLATVIMMLIASAEFANKPASPQRTDPSPPVVTSTYSPTVTR